MAVLPLIGNKTPRKQGCWNLRRELFNLAKMVSRISRALGRHAPISVCSPLHWSSHYANDWSVPCEQVLAIRAEDRTGLLDCRRDAA